MSNPTDWIYDLEKGEVRMILTELGMSTEGTVRDCTGRLKEHLEQRDEQEGVRIKSMYEKYKGDIASERTDAELGSQASLNDSGDTNAFNRFFVRKTQSLEKLMEQTEKEKATNPTTENLEKESDPAWQNTE